MGLMGVMGVKFFEPPSSSFQGGRHISHQASLLPEERGCNRPPVLLFYLSVSPARRAPHPNQATIGFTTLSVPLTGDRNPSRKGKDVTALSAVFLKSSRPSLPLKKAPPLISVFSPQGRRGKPPSGARNRYAIRLAGHQSPAPSFAGWDRLGNGA